MTTSELDEMHLQNIARRTQQFLAGLDRPDPIPPGVRRCLEEPQLVARLMGLLRRLSGYQNLTHDQRRERANVLGRAALLEEGHALGEHEISILIALLYWRVKEETPFLIAPEPKRF